MDRQPSEPRGRSSRVRATPPVPSPRASGACAGRDRGLGLSCRDARAPPLLVSRRAPRWGPPMPRAGGTPCAPGSPRCLIRSSSETVIAAGRATASKTWVPSQGKSDTPGATPQTSQRAGKRKHTSYTRSPSPGRDSCERQPLPPPPARPPPPPPSPARLRPPTSVARRGPARPCTTPAPAASGPQPLARTRAHSQPGPDPTAASPQRRRPHTTRRPAAATTARWAC
jgi:hypothetical protein